MESISTTRSPADRLARAITELFAPAVLIAALLIVVGLHAAHTSGASPWWGAAAALFAAAIPFAYIIQAVRRGHVTDHHIARRDQRHIPLAFGATSLALGLLLLITFDAPRDLTAVLATGGAGVAICALITTRWKISIHASVATGTATVLTVLLGPSLLVTAPIALAVAWSRVRLRAHTPAQTVAGLALGTALAATLFPALR